MRSRNLLKILSWRLCGLAVFMLVACGSDAGGRGQDSGPDSAAASDTGPLDTGARETAAVDTGRPEAGTLDADGGAMEASLPDTGTSDTSTQNSSDAGDGGPNPDCAANNGGADCTPTEALFEAHAPSCYKCLVNAGCLNDTISSDMGHECADVVGNAARGSRTGTARSTLCLDTLRCILQTGCASSDVAICYCGSLGAGGGCTMSMDPTAANGACAQTELDGMEHLSADPPSLVAPDFFNLNLGAGKANQIFSCASSNGGCPTCLH
jgi:hypothetical protein